MSEAKVVIVTGASRGIGLAVAKYLLGANCNLVLLARSAEPLERLQKDYPARVETIIADLGDLSQDYGQKSVDAAIASWGRLDGLVVNHGVLEPVKRISDVEIGEWRKAFDTNFVSAVALVKAALPYLRRTQGRIIFTSSGASVDAYATWGSYGTAKAALNHFAKTLAVEEPDITSISIRPGVVDTEMQRQIRELFAEKMDKKDAKKFATLKENGSLLKPEQPGHVTARLVLEGPKTLSGRFISWNDKDLAQFQEP